jgi:hypothetical protein
MRKFIITDGCRREVSSSFMDGRERVVNCEQVGGEMCDQCMGRDMMEEEEEERRVRAVERDEREESRAVARMQGRCRIWRGDVRVVG